MKAMRGYIGTLTVVAMLTCASGAVTAQESPRATAAESEYTVEEGDTLFSIARRFGLDYDELAHLNELPSDYRIQPGQVLILQGPEHEEPASVAAALPDAQPRDDWQLPDPEYRDGSPEALQSGPAVFVQRIDLQGNTVLPATEVSRVTATYENRSLTSEELQEARHELSELYVKNGYISSGVLVPDQEVNGGVIKMQAVEGRVGSLQVSTTGRLAESYVRNRVKPGLSEPVNVATVQGALRELQQDPRVKQVNAELLPGMEPGLNVLSVAVVENVNHSFSLAADNHRPASVDENRISARFFHRNLTGHGDVLTAEAGLTEGLQDYLVSYNFPITARDMRLRIYSSRTDSDIVEKPFQFLDIVSETERHGIQLSRPFRTRGGAVIAASAGFEYKTSESSLLGIPFSFSPGDVNGESSAAVVPISVEWIHNTATRALAIRGTARIGVDTLDATVNESAPDTEFVSFLAQLHYIREFGWRNSRLILRAAGQGASDPLLAFEKFALGGYSTVRGYRENLFVRDNGLFASLEYQLPPFLNEFGGDRFGLRLAAFADYGVAWDKDKNLPTSDRDDIFSVGLGILWNPSRFLSAQIYYGYAIEEMNLPTESLQDRGFHFALVFTPFGGV